MDECRISELTDLPQLAQCHTRAFPGSLSSHQGPGFVMKMLEWYIMAERGVMFHVMADGQIVGYCGGIRIHEPGLPGAVTSISQHSFWAFVRAYLKKPWLILHPENLKRRGYIARNILIRLRPKKARTSISQATREEFRTSWGLVVIGVAPDCQGRGIGGRMLREFERLAHLDGVDRIQLSVKPANQQAIRSYKRNGWAEVERTEDSILMRKELND
jgi:ribosomal protein S18 acetylase RimI-like enzyme